MTVVDKSVQRLIRTLPSWTQVSLMASQDTELRGFPTVPVWSSIYCGRTLLWNRRRLVMLERSVQQLQELIILTFDLQALRNDRMLCASGSMYTPPNWARVSRPCSRLNSGSTLATIQSTVHSQLQTHIFDITAFDYNPGTVRPFWWPRTQHQAYGDSLTVAFKQSVSKSRSAPWGKFRVWGVSLKTGMLGSLHDIDCKLQRGIIKMRLTKNVRYFQRPKSIQIQSPTWSNSNLFWT